MSCNTATAKASVVVMNELVDLAIRLHGHMSSLGQLGESESRLKVRLWLHLQCVTMFRKHYTSHNAMSAFKTGTEIFLRRIPNSTFAQNQRTRMRKGKETLDYMSANVSRRGTKEKKLQVRCVSSTPYPRPVGVGSN